MNSSGTKSEPRDPKAEKRERILEAAAAVFADQGFVGSTIAHVAKAAGIGKGTVYEYVKSKDELFYEVFNWYTAQFREALAMAMPEEVLAMAPPDRLRSLTKGFITLVAESMDIYNLILEFWAASASASKFEDFHESFKQAYEDLRGLVAAIIIEGVEKGDFDPATDPEAFAAGYVGSLDAFGLQAWFDADFPLMRHAQSFTETLLKGLAAHS